MVSYVDTGGPHLAPKGSLRIGYLADRQKGQEFEPGSAGKMNKVAQDTVIGIRNVTLNLVTGIGEFSRF